MGEWLLSRRDSTIVARHEVPGLQFGHFLVRIPSARRTNGKQPRASALGKVRRLALPKQDRIMLPAGLDILGRPKGENRIAHGLQPWDSMAFQKLTKLFLIRKFAVMLGLIGNVGGNGLYARLAD